MEKLGAFFPTSVGFARQSLFPTRLFPPRHYHCLLFLLSSLSPPFSSALHPLSSTACTTYGVILIVLELKEGGPSAREAEKHEASNVGEGGRSHAGCIWLGWSQRWLQLL